MNFQRRFLLLRSRALGMKPKDAHLLDPHTAGMAWVVTVACPADPAGEQWTHPGFPLPASDLPATPSTLRPSGSGSVWV